MKVDARNVQGLTSLHIAADHGNLHIVQLLLTANPDLHIVDNDNETADRYLREAQKLYAILHDPLATQIAQTLDHA